MHRSDMPNNTTEQWKWTEAHESTGWSLETRLDFSKSHRRIYTEQFKK